MPTERSLCTPCLFDLNRTYYEKKPYDNPMAQCLWGLVPIERAAALMFFIPHTPEAALVYRLKYGGRPDIGEDIGRIMANVLLPSHFFDGIDALVPVPLSPKRMRQRGYNQSQMLAEGISDITHIPVLTKAVGRKHFHESQTKLTRKERRQNVEHMFFLTDGTLLEGRHILLIDDVCTTGATLTACAEAIKNIKGVQISILTLGFTKK